MLLFNANECLKNNPNLIYDEACLDIINKLNQTVTVFGQYKECHQCDFQKLATLPPSINTSVTVNTNSPFQFYYSTGDNNPKCQSEKLLYEHYRYGWNITEKCPPVYIKEEADNAYLPILTAFIVLFCFGTVWYMVKCIYKNSGRLRALLTRSSEFQEDLGGSSTAALVIPKPPSAHKHPNRIKSIDVFRGFCISMMIFVNYGGGKYVLFSHSIWNGLTVADLVFPWFLWIMGFSLSVSLQSKLRRAVPRRQLVIQTIRRSFILILLGIVVNSNQNTTTIAELRFPGVLQRIGIAYLVVGLLEIAFTKRIETEEISLFHDLIISWPQWLFVLTLVSIHTCVTYLVEVPDCGRGYLGPGGLDQGGKYFNCTGGVAGYVDRAVFGAHMYKRHPMANLYEQKLPFDPEGILGTLTSILSVYLGVHAGRILKTFQSVRAKVIRWMVWGVTTGLLGGILCEFTKNDGVMPINKRLWSTSFALATAGMAFLIQSALFVLVDIMRKWGGRPLFYPGMNSIVLYVGHELFRHTFPFAWKPTSLTHGTFLFMNLWGTFLWVSFSIFLYKKNIFLSI